MITTRKGIEDKGSGEIKIKEDKKKKKGRRTRLPDGIGACAAGEEFIGSAGAGAGAGVGVGAFITLEMVIASQSMFGIGRLMPMVRICEGARSQQKDGQKCDRFSFFTTWGRAVRIFQILKGC